MSIRKRNVDKNEIAPSFVMTTFKKAIQAEADWTDKVKKLRVNLSTPAEYFCFHALSPARRTVHMVHYALGLVQRCER